MEREELQKIMELSLVQPNPVGLEQGKLYVDLDHVKLKINPKVQHFESNLCAMSRINSFDPGDIIEKVKYIFNLQERNEFSWWVSDLTTPHSLGDYLEQHGFVHDHKNLGLVIKTDKNTGIEYNPDLKFEEIDADILDQDEYRQVITEGFGVSEDMVDDIVNSYRISADKGRRTVYAVNHKADDRPISIASLRYLVTHQNIAKLDGAATLPDYRGQGAYSGLLRYRIEQSRKDGIDYIFTLANAETSAPILLDYGFEQDMKFDVYTYNFSS